MRQAVKHICTGPLLSFIDNNQPTSLLIKYDCRHILSRRNSHPLHTIGQEYANIEQRHNCPYRPRTSGLVTRGKSFSRCWFRLLYFSFESVPVGLGHHGQLSRARRVPAMGGLTTARFTAARSSNKFLNQLSAGWADHADRQLQNHAWLAQRCLNRTAQTVHIWHFPGRFDKKVAVGFKCKNVNHASHISVITEFTDSYKGRTQEALKCSPPSYFCLPKARILW